VTQSSAELLVGVFEKLRYLQGGYLEMTISIKALLGAMQEAYPNLRYAQHHQDATKSAQAQKIREQLKETDASIAALKNLLSGRVD